MNAYAHKLVAMLRAVLVTLPGATSISIHTTSTWTLVWLTAAWSFVVSRTPSGSARSLDHLAIPYKIDRHFFRGTERYVASYDRNDWMG